MPDIKRNAFRCKKCGMVVESKSVHDFEQCKCGNFTDGGLEYVRRGGKIEDMEDLSEPHMYFAVKKVEEELDNLMHDNHRDLSHEAVVVDNFWVEIAEHFRAIAELCEERSKNGK